MIERRHVAALCALVLAVGACGTGGSSQTPGGASASRGGASPTSADRQPTADEFANPVLLHNFPDPYVFRVDNGYYAYATTNGQQHLQMAQSADLVTWRELGDPLPKLPSWSNGETWAPEVVRTSASFVMYYTARDKGIRRPDGNNAQCIGIATAKSAAGPFADAANAPFICQADLGGSIDATEFQDRDGKRYLIWKNDGNCCKIPTKFYIQPLTADGRKLSGKAADLGLVNDVPWEGDVIEAPTVLLRDGTYYLFYSANAYDSEFYSIGYATSKKLTGPYVDAPENPIVASAWDRPITSRARGPGHQSIVEDDDGELWMAFHAWDQDAVGYSNTGSRTLWIDKLTFKDGKPVVDGPKDSPQPKP